LASGPSARADTAQGLFDSAQKQYEQLLKSEKRRSSKSSWLVVIKAFDRLVRECPSSDEAPRALFAEGCIYREMFNYSITLGELNKAEETFKKFIKKYPGHGLAAEAQKNIEEIRQQKNKSNLMRVSMEKPKPEEFPGRETALKDDRDTKSDDNGVTKKTTKTDTTPGTNDVKPTRSSATASIEKIRYFTDTTRTRIVVDLDSQVTYDDAALPSDNSNGMPHRIYIDLFDVRTASNLYSPLFVKDGLVSCIRWTKKKDGTVRVVLDLEKFADYKVFSLVNPNRLVIDVLRN